MCLFPIVWEIPDMFGQLGMPPVGALLALLSGFGGPTAGRAAEPHPGVKAKPADRAVMRVAA